MLWKLDFSQEAWREDWILSRNCKLFCVHAYAKRLCCVDHRVKTKRPFFIFAKIRNFAYIILTKFCFLEYFGENYLFWSQRSEKIFGLCSKTRSVWNHPNFHSDTIKKFSPWIRANFRAKYFVQQSLYAYSPLNEAGGQGTESTHPLLQVNETLKVLLGLHMLTKEEKLAKQLIRFYQCSYENSKNSLVFMILTK
jgi:hypothetical protein